MEKLSHKSQKADIKEINSVFDRIVKHRHFIIVVFAILVFFSLFSMNWVRVEEDTVYFLDESTQSRQCVDIDSEEFTEFGSMYFMVSDISKAEVDAIKDKVEKLDNVAYFNDNISRKATGYTATYYLSFMSKADDPESMKTIKEISKIPGQYDNSYVYSELLEDMEDMVNHQMAVVIGVIALAVLLILLLACRSFAEIPVFLLVFVVAALLNMGSNFALGTISIISNAVAVTLQLALSLDYAIILSNRYWEAHQTLPVRDAVSEALKGAAPEILASSLTTMAGLFAMTFMTFGLGRDMGIVLIKAIVISLITVFLLMPALLILFGKMMDKTIHKRLIPQSDMLGRFAHKTRHVIPALFVIILVAAYCMFSNVNCLYNEMEAPVNQPLDITVAYAAITEELGTNDVEILVPAGDYHKEKALIEALAAETSVRTVSGLANTEAVEGYYLADDIGVEAVQKLAEVDKLTAKGIMALYAVEKGQPEVLSEQLDSFKAPLIDVFTCLYKHIDDPKLEVSDEQRETVKKLYNMLDRMKSELQGPRYSRLLLSLDAPLDSAETRDILTRLQNVAKSFYPNDTHIAGFSMVYSDFAESFQTDKTITSVLSIVLVMLILLFAFRALAMPVLLILVIQGSIWLNFGIHSLVGGNVYFICYLIVSSIMMGSNIDYAIVISSRFRELRGRGTEPREAISQTMSFALPTVLTSGGIMTLSGLLIYQLVSTGVVACFGLYLATGTLITMCLVLFALPQLLLVTEGAVRKTSFSLPTLYNPRKARRVAVTLICVLVMTASCVGYVVAGQSLKDRLYENDNEMAYLEDIEAELSQVESSLEGFNYFGLVEQFLTGDIGYDELMAAKTELKAGEKMLEAGQAEYDAGLAEYNDYLNQYRQGEAELAAGEKELNDNTKLYNESYAQYEDGMKLYQDNLKLYEEGKQQLIDGQKEYDAALEEYNAGKAELEKYTGLYNLLVGGYNKYRDLQARYDSAVAAGDLAKAALLHPTVYAAKVAYETNLTSYGSIESILEKYEAGKAELEAAEKQLADAKKEIDEGKATLADAERQLKEGKQELSDAERQLEDGKRQLDDGKRQLDDGKAQLSDAKRQLDQGKSELDAGAKELSGYYAEYKDGKKQIDDAEKMLSENEEKYSDGTISLGELLEKKNKLDAKLHLLNCASEVQVGNSLNGSSLFAAEYEYCKEAVSQARSELNELRWICAFAFLVGLVGLIITCIIRRKTLVG